MFQAIRIPGVLQRIGVVYLITAIVAIYAKPWQRTALIVVLLLGHWALLVFLPWHPPGLPFAQRMNVSGVVDRAMFGRHILTPTGDPEGILGTLPSVASALLGLAIGEYVRGHQRERRTNLALTLGGFIIFLAGLAWSMVLPLNKNLWTGSFVLVTAGLAMIALAGLHYVIDVHGWRRWAGPFLWLGFNPLVIYFLSECFGHIVDYPVLHIAGKVTTARTWMYWDTLRPVLGRLSEEAMSLTYATLVVLVWTSIAGVFYQKRWRFRL